MVHGFVIGKLASRVRGWIRAALTIDWAPISEIQRLWSFGAGFGSKVGQGEQANVITSPVNWIVRTFLQGTPVVQRRSGGKWVSIDEHDLTDLLRRPNPFYNGDVLMSGLLLSFFYDGNGYMRKIRSSLREVVELWYIPHWLIEPKWPEGGGAFISHYEYQPLEGGPKTMLSVNDIVHVRCGMDPSNPRKGMSALKTVLREALTDEEASEFAAYILQNMGVPGGVISPDSGSTTMPSTAEIEELQRYMGEEFSGKKRGGWLVTGKPTKIQQFGFDPNNLQLGPLRDISEERVCAALGTPAAVVGFGAGLQQTKVGATMRELVRLARVNCIAPNQTTIGRQIGDQLLPDFEVRPLTMQLGYDNTGVGMFQEDETEAAKRADVLFKARIAKRNEARAMVGLEPDEVEGDEYYSGGPAATPPAMGTDDPPDDGHPLDPPQPPPANRVAALIGTNGNGTNGGGA